jgi:hypothetical protein
MNKQNLINEIKELIFDKKNLLEGDELDVVFARDIDVLEKALQVIKERPKGVWIATMDSECYGWTSVGRTEDEAINGIVAEWNKSPRRDPMTREELEDYYGINCEFIKYGACEWR